MVVGRRERDDLADAEPGDRAGIGALVLGRVVDRADADDGALAGHEPGDGVDGADRPRVGQRHRGAGEVRGRDLAGADPADDVLVGGEVAVEVEGVGRLDVGDEQAVRTVGLADVDGQSQVDVGMADDARLPVHLGVAGVHHRHLLQPPHDGPADEVGEADLALALDPDEVVVGHPPVDLQQPGGHHPRRRGRGDGEAGLHVLHDQGARSPDGSGSIRRGYGSWRGARGWCLRRRRCLSGRLGDRRRVRYAAVAAGVGREPRCVVGEEVPPALGHRGRVLQPLPVDLLDQAHVGPEVAFEPPDRRDVVCSHGLLSAPQQLGHLEGEIERLAGVQAGVAHRLVAGLEVVGADLVGPPEAFGHVLPGELHVDAAGP